MRFSESDYTSPSQLDFVPRERRSQIWRVIIAFSITIALIFILNFVPTTQDSRFIAGLASMGVIMVLCFYVVFRKQQSLDLVMSTEYQNMLLTEALGLGSAFCLFVRRDGTIVYANDGLRKLFPHFAYSDSQALEGIFEQGGVRKVDRERMMAAIYAGQSERLIFPLPMRDGTEREFILTLDSLPRPGGHMMIRGREYLDARAGTQMMPDLLRSTSVERLEHLLHHTPVPLLVTDAFGRLEYINPALEESLGYEGGEMLTSKMSLHHVLYQTGGHPVSDDYVIGDYHGAATLQKKHGGLLKVHLHQTLIRDMNEKVTGLSATILPALED